MIIEKLFLGVSLAAPIGPVTIEMIRRGLKNGFLSAFAIRLGGAFGNTMCLLAAYFGLSSIVDKPGIMKALGIFGILFLLYLGFKTIKSAFKTGSIDLESSPTEKNALLFGLVLAIANPVSIAFWLGMFAANLQKTGSQANLIGLLENLLIIVGVLLWGTMLSTVLAVGRKYVTPFTCRVITFFAGVCLLGYGLNYGVNMLI